MPLSSQKKNFIFITFAIISTIVISIFSYFYFSSVFEDIERSINNNNTKHFISSIDRNIKHSKHMASDYARDDDLYTFMTNKNPDYIYKHYKVGSYALENLGLSFIFINDLENNNIFAHKSSYEGNINLEKINKYILSTFKENITSSILNMNGKFFIITKEEITNSNSNKRTNGYFYTGIEIQKKELEEYNALIFTVKEKNNINLTKQEYQVYNTKNFKQILVESRFLYNSIYKQFHFYDNNMNYSFSIKTKNDYIMLEQGKKKILVYNLVIITSLLLIFFLIYKFQKFLNINKKQLERLVNLKTKQTKTTLKQLEIAHKKLFAIANTDYLTKINNRRSFFCLSEQTFLRANDCNEDLSLIMIDIDNFKQINDTYGHDVGDEILKMFVKAFKPHLGKEDIFGRLGGEEFAITLPRCNLEEARIKAEILRAALQQAVTHNNTKKIGITASFGVAQMQGNTCIDEILQTADNLLYAAKKSGKNRVRSRIMPMDRIKEQIENL